MAAASLPESKSTYTQTVFLLYNDDSNPKNFDLRSPFTPDVVDVQAFVAPADDGKNGFTPVNSGGSFDNSNIFIMYLSCLPSENFVLANLLNSCNPVLSIKNTTQNNFQGTYQCNAFNSMRLTPVTLGQIILQFTFTKYR